MVMTSSVAKEFIVCKNQFEILSFFLPKDEHFFFFNVMVDILHLIIAYARTENSVANEFRMRNIIV